MFQYLVLIILGSILSFKTYSQENQETKKFNKTLVINKNYLVYIKETEDEPQSIGSYSVFLYKVIDKNFPRDNFLDGKIKARDGFISNIIFCQKGQNSGINIIIESAGSGKYFSVDNYRVRDDNIKFMASKNIDNYKKDINELCSN